jgi:hypothetical protein
MVGERPTYAAHRTVQPSQETFFKLVNFSWVSLYIIRDGRSIESAMGWGGGEAHSALFCELISLKSRVRACSSRASSAAITN